jgi:hypothetical protein
MPHKTASKEAKELRIRTFEDFFKRLGSWNPFFAPRVRDNNSFVIIIKE